MLPIRAQHELQSILVEVPVTARDPHGAEFNPKIKLVESSMLLQNEAPETDLKHWVHKDSQSRLTNI